MVCLTQAIKNRPWFLGPASQLPSALCEQVTRSMEHVYITRLEKACQHQPGVPGCLLVASLCPGLCRRTTHLQACSLCEWPPSPPLESGSAQPEQMHTVFLSPRQS